jgi:hypothetical protein
VSYAHPSAPCNSGNHNTDGYDLLTWRQRNATLAPPDKRIVDSPLWSEFFQWKRIKEDVIHVTPFDRLPQEQRDAIKARRFLAFQESHIPWIVTDSTGLLQALDDVDDMIKSARFVTDYAVKPLVGLTEAAITLARDGPRAALNDFRGACKLPAHGRDRKLAFLRSINGAGAGTLATLALAALFPLWRFVALGLQFLQTTDNFFGVGIQLGPVLGIAQEQVFRTLHDVGLPFGPENNKYNQILAARVTHRTAFLNAAHQALHPEDRLSALAAAHQASTGEYMKYIVLTQDDYPKAMDLFMHPSTQLENYRGLVKSLPYNMAAAVVNNFIAPMFDNWSKAVNGVEPPAPPKHIVNSLEKRVLGLAELNICPDNHCSAAIWQHLAIENNVTERLDPISKQIIDAYHYFKALLWDVPPEVIT